VRKKIRGKRSLPFGGSKTLHQHKPVVQNFQQIKTKKVRQVAEREENLITEEY